MDGEQSDLKQYADRLEFACRQQMAEITKLRAEVERLRAQGGAHSFLKSVYWDETAPQGNRIKAATAALPMETPKLLPERAPLELEAETTETLFEQADRRMKKQMPLEGRDIEVQPNGQIILLPPNGSSGDDSND